MLLALEESPTGLSIAQEAGAWERPQPNVSYRNGHEPFPCIGIGRGATLHWPAEAWVSETLRNARRRAPGGADPPNSPKRKLGAAPDGGRIQGWSESAVPTRHHRRLPRPSRVRPPVGSFHPRPIPRSAANPSSYPAKHTASYFSDRHDRSMKTSSRQFPAMPSPSECPSTSPSSSHRITVRPFANCCCMSALGPEESATYRPLIVHVDEHRTLHERQTGGDFDREAFRNAAPCIPRYRRVRNDQLQSAVAGLGRLEAAWDSLPSRRAKR